MTIANRNNQDICVLFIFAFPNKIKYLSNFSGDLY